MAELDSDPEDEEGVSSMLMYLPALMGCRNVESFEWLNRIEEGTYGVVHRAKDKKTGQSVQKREGRKMSDVRLLFDQCVEGVYGNVVYHFR